MILSPDDFPLRAFGSLIYSQTRGEAIMNVCSADMAAQVVRSLNKMAVDECAGTLFIDRIKIH